ncbi:MAG: hypothetical protein B6D63_00395 [Candidatus Latescibacteria bacterium 4484_7]|nr:MAG: hypothetical protein B6D63_00395 [Candidatus Latescibacteria bacterium 4484_7]RKZ08726.1 MAG: HDOD domain-containing protein [bacterium]
MVVESKAPSLKKIIMITGDLPPMPYVARKVMEIVGDSSASAQDLQEVISKDQGLTSQILKIANSALYARSRKIETLTDAIVMLGFNTIKSLSVMNATKNLYKFMNKGKVFGLKDKLLWEHSVGAALTARAVAQKINSRFVEQAFLGGLLHDIGKLVLLQKVPEIFDSVIEEVYNTGRHFSEVEMEKLGFTHAEVGAHLMGKWKFTGDFEEAVRNHHAVTSDLQVESQLVYYIDFANRICHKLGIGFINEPDIDLSQEYSAVALGLNEQMIEGIEHLTRYMMKQEMNTFM